MLALASAFAAGLASFLSPCVLPLVPVYLAQLVGPSIWESQVRGQTRGGSSSAALGASLATRGRTEILLHAAAFVAGFSLVFVALGASASALGALLVGDQESLRRVGGIALALFGLHIAGFIQVPWLQREHRFHLRVGTPGYLTSLALGLVFALGWTPCVGPLLASILVLAAQARTLAAGVGLLAVYALGLGVPFLLAGAACDRLVPALGRLSPHLGLIERVAGMLLVLLGVAIYFNWLLSVSSWLTIGLWPLGVR